MKKALITLFLIGTLLCTTLLAANAAFLGGAAAVLTADVTLIKTALRGEKILFSDTDFKEALAVPTISSITVASLPSSTEGTLLLAGRRVASGQTIKRKNIGALCFVPAAKTVSECKFSFTSEGLAGGAEIVCTLKFVDKVNYAPTIDEAVSTTLSVKTQADVSLFGELCAEDPEGDELTYMIVSYPQNGILTLLDAQSGEYRYTPAPTYTGKDRFIYVARDEYGNYSYPAAVEIAVGTRLCDAEYTDMKDRKEYNAALAMEAEGIMAGVPLGDDLLFLPEEQVTRAEFLTMAMKALGIRRDTTLLTSCFDDDADIPSSLRGYVATAQRIGAVTGEFVGGKLLFSPNETITRHEAARLLAALTDTQGSASTALFSDTSLTVGTRTALDAMLERGIFRLSDGDLTQDAPVTRAETALWLYRLAF